MMNRALPGLISLPEDVPPEIPATDPPALQQTPRSRALARSHRIALIACCVALFAYLLHTVGLTAIVTAFRNLSWRLGLVVLFPAVALKVSDTLGWNCVLPRHDVGFWRLATSLVAGQAVASTTPTGTIGGDAVKAWMLRDRLSVRDSLSSLIIVETASTASQGIFLLLGILIARQTLALSAPLLRIMEWLLLLEIIGVGGFIAVQMWGIATKGYALLARIGLAPASNTGAAAAHLDRVLANFYQQEPRRLALSVTWHFLGWLIGALEVWLILYFLKDAVSLGMALLIEAFGTGISFATFFLPVQIGIDEGGAVATFVALGLNGATGLALVLVRRVREMVWISIGLLALASRPGLQGTRVAAREA
jgi:glycosyltransferase 2 family protein